MSAGVFITGADTGIGKQMWVLCRGGRAAFPSEMVYGLRADARKPDAMAHVCRSKGRQAGPPLIRRLGDMGALAEWAREVAAMAWRLAARLWPPLAREQAGGGAAP